MDSAKDPITVVDDGSLVPNVLRFPNRFA